MKENKEMRWKIAHDKAKRGCKEGKNRSENMRHKS